YQLVYNVLPIKNQSFFYEKTHPLLLFQGDINIRKNKFFYLYKKKENDKTEQHNTLNPSQSIKQ
ncbi:hypothetical protein ACMH1A_004661, partial [Escherichia coli]